MMPDSEALVIDALNHYLAGEGVTIATTPPKGWNATMPFASVLRFDGNEVDPRYLELSLFTVEVFAETREEASDVARRIQAALKQAAKDQFSNEEGVITRFKTSKPPVQIRDGLSGKHADAAMFDATYTVWARPHYA